MFSMRGMRLLATFTGAVALVFGSMLPLAASADTVLKFGSFVGKRNPIFECSIVPIMEDIKSRSGVEFEEYFGGGAFGSPVQQYSQVSRGITDMAFGMFSYTEGQFPLTELISLPLVVEDHELATRILTEKIFPQYLGDELNEVKVINMWTSSLNQFHMRRPINDPSDLSGVRMRIAGEITTAAIRALGAQAATFPAPASYENLQRGVVDGTSATWTTAEAFRVREVTSHHYNVNFGNAVGFTLMNRRTYDRLPDDVREVIDEHSGAESSMRVARCFTQADERGLELTRAQGNEIIDVPDEKREEMRAKVAPVIEAHLERLESRGLPAREVYELIRTEAAAAAEQ